MTTMKHRILGKNWTFQQEAQWRGRKFTRYWHWQRTNKQTEKPNNSAESLENHQLPVLFCRTAATELRFPVGARPCCQTPWHWAALPASAFTCSHTALHGYCWFPFWSTAKLLAVFVTERETTCSSPESLLMRESLGLLNLQGVRSALKSGPEGHGIAEIFYAPACRISLVLQIYNHRMTYVERDLKYHWAATCPGPPPNLASGTSKNRAPRALGSSDWA